MATQLSGVAPLLLPPTITEPIFAKAVEQSAVQKFARRVPLSVSAQTAIPVSMDVPVAGWVSEGGAKPAAQGGMGVKMMTGKKLALILPVSQEVAMSNPAGLYSQLENDLPTAMARSFDQACINGKDLRTGGAGPFADYLALTQNSVALGTATQANGGLYADFVNGAGLVVDRNYDFTGIVADPRAKIDAQLQTDTQGRPLFVDSLNDAGMSASTLASFPATFSKGVSGRYWRGGDSVQTLTINGTPTGGTFTIAASGNSYTAAYNVSASTLQTQIQSWGGVFANVTVTGTGPFTITFPQVAANVSAAAVPLQVNGKGLTGGTNASATIVPAGAGGTDSLVRAVGGDWSQCAYGVGMDISVRVSNEGSYFDGTNWHSAFQENLVLLLVEAYYGFVVGDPNAFVLYTKGTAKF